MGFRKGTGFTNLNKVMTANRGNKLGSAVAGGISTQTQGVNTGIQNAQQTFGQEAEKNRLDTDEAKNKRDQTLGRFDEANYKPDESKFQVSSGLQDQYTQQKTTLQGQQAANKAESDKQYGAIRDRLKADQAALAGPGKSYSVPVFKSGNPGMRVVSDSRARKGLTASVNTLGNLLNTYGAQAKGQAAEYNTQLTGLDTQLANMTADEKAAFMKTETGRLMAENAPGEQEIRDFQNYRTGTYAGPTELGDIGSLYGKAQQAEQAGELSRSTGGQQELLRRFVGGGKDYSQGERQLDTSLLGQDADAMRIAARGTRGAANRVGEANQAASGLAQEYVGRAKIFGDETRQKLDAAGQPISAGVDKAVLDAQNAETGRAGALKSYQSILTGTDPKYANLDKTTRAGLALQDAMNSGYLSPQDAEKLAGQGGLMGRANKLGLDTNKLISERFSGTNAQNINRAGVASDVDAARLNALGKLSGKTGTDLEFQDARNRYQAGGIGLNTGSLQDYITRTENEKMPQGGSSGGSAGIPGAGALQKIISAGTSPSAGVGLLAGGLTTGAAQQAAAQAAARSAAIAAGETAGAQAAGAAGLEAGMGATAEYGAMAIPGAENAAAQIAMGQPGALGLEAVGTGGVEAAGAGSGAGVGAGTVALAAMLGYDTLTGKDETAKMAEGGVQLGSMAAGKGLEGKNAILKALMNNKIGNSAAGEQIQKLLGSEQELERKGLGELTKEGMNYGQGIRDLTQSGRLDQALAKLTGYDAVKNLYSNAGNEVGKKLSTAFGGGKTGNWGTGEYNTIDASTGKKVKVGTYANKSSDAIMKQMLDTKQLSRSGVMGKGGAEGAKQLNELQKYYAAALKREGKKYSDEDLKENVDYTDKDVSSFMDRIKPASYDYKEEVKDSPLASKDRQLGVMAQDLEKSKLGKEAVSDTEQGKIVDYKDLQPKMLASLAALNQRLKKIEGKE